MGCTQSSAPKTQPPHQAAVTATPCHEHRPEDPPAADRRSAVAAAADGGGPQDTVAKSNSGSPSGSHRRRRHETGAFQNGGPSAAAAGGVVTPCFKSGLLFRIVKEDRWYFYNDSSDYEMQVTFTYGPLSEVTLLEGTATAPPAPTGTDWKTVTMLVYPGETKALMEGTFNGYKSKYNAQPLSAEYKTRMAKESEERVRLAIARVAALGSHSLSEEQRLALCVERQIAFVDVSFPPLAESLSKRDDARQLTPTAWLRPTEFVLGAENQSKICVFDGIAPDDIDQGQLGDCWFLCSVASVAEYPERIRALFEHPVSALVARREQAIGAYSVTLNKNGWWRVVILDDYLPCVGGRPCFAKNQREIAELWPALIEKAYAKLHGSYSSITGGDALQALQDLTGYPTNRFDTEWDEAVKDRANDGLAMFAELLRCREEEYLITVNTPGVDNSAYMGTHRAANTKDFEAAYAAAGLSMGHAYSVLDVRKFPKEGVYLIKIRNPWGNDVEWTGDWSFSSALWSQYPRIAAACGPLSADDGTFWMSWTDVKKYFDGGGVCFTKFHWYDYRVQGSWSSGEPSLILEVTVTGEDVDVFFILSQPDRRGQPRGSPNAKYAAIMLSVCRPDAAVSDRVRVDRNSSCDADRPKDAFTFLYARDVALRYRFSAVAADETHGRPYLVVPRLFDAPGTPSKSFVLGIIASKAVRPGAFEIKFRGALAPSTLTPILQNYTGFPYNPSSSAAAVPHSYQCLAKIGRPVTATGTEIVMPKVP